MHNVPSILRGRSRTGRASIAAVACVMTGALLLSLSATGFAAGERHVVPPNGKVAGRGYAYYQKRDWQVYFSTPAPGPKACATLTVGGKKVALVSDGRGGHITCSEPAGRPIYLPGPGNECSTLPGDHSGYGTTDQQLKRCAAAGMKGATVRAWFDGHRVPGFQKSFITATRVYLIKLPKNRFKGIKQRRGRSAADGYGLLVIGLTKGTYTLRNAVTFASGGGGGHDVTVHVQ